jgi:Carboxypeptidase regulatory-like domain
MALQRTRRPRLRSGCSLRSLGSPLNARPFGAAMVFIVLSPVVMVGCAAHRTANLSSVSGLVVDDHGIRLPGATVDLTYSLGRAAQVSAITSPDGEYDVHGIRAGVYQLRATLPGFDLIEPLGITLPRGASTRAPVLRLRPRALTGPVASGARELIKAQLAALRGLMQRHRIGSRDLLIAMWDDSDTDFKSPPPSLVEAVSTVTAAAVRPLPEERTAAVHAMADPRNDELLVVATRPDAAAPSLVLIRGAVEVGRSLWWYRVHLKPGVGGWVADQFVKTGVAK